MKKVLFPFLAVAMVIVMSSFAAAKPSSAEPELATCKVYGYDQDGKRHLLAKCFACNCAALYRATKSK